MEREENDGRITTRLLFVTITAALGGLLFGFDSAVINGTVDAVRSQFGLSSGVIGFTVSCALLGAMLGAWSAGICADRFGRVKTMLIAAVLLIASALGSGFAYGVVDLILWRFIGGIGIGFASVIAPAYIAEIAPAKWRGRLGSMQQLAIVIGIFVALLTNALISNISGGASGNLAFGLEAWRWMFLAELVPAILYGVLAFSLPESPRFLIARKRFTEAAEILANTVGISGDAEIQEKIKSIEGTLDYEKKQSIRDILGGKFIFIPIVWVGILISVFQQLVGINVIFYYSTSLWNSVGFDESYAFTLSVVNSAVNLVATFVAIALIDRVGRKKLLLSGSAIMTVTLAIMAIAFNQARLESGQLSLPDNWGIIALVAANLFIIGFAASWGPVVWVMLGEIFPNRIRAFALGVSAAAQWLANFLISTSFPALADIGLSLAYGLYAFFALLSLIYVAKFVKETKGKTLEEME